MRKHLVRRSTRNRSNRRGVALVEGVVVLPLLVMIFPLSMYAWTVFGARVAAQSDTRSRVFYESMHDCIGTDRWINANAGSLPAPAAGLAAVMAGSDGKGATIATRADLGARGERTVTRASYGRFARTLENTSFVLCNDPPEDAHIVNWFYGGAAHFAGQYGYP